MLCFIGVQIFKISDGLFKIIVRRVSESIVTWKELLKAERFLHCSFQSASVGGRSQLCESQGCENGYRRQEPGNLQFNCSTSR